MMSLDTLLEHLDTGQPLVTGTEAFDCMHGYSYEAMRLTAELNNAFHTPEEIREIMGRITGRPIDETFRLFPPFYTDFGKNIRIGRRVFIMFSSMPAAVSRIRAGSASVTGRSSGTG